MLTEKPHSLPDKTQIRLQKIIADAGIASRREAEKMIAEGKVTVNGKIVAQPGTLADPEHDTIKVRGRLLPRQHEKVYLVLNKPARCLTTTKDDRARPTVMEFVRKLSVRVFPVGRLDYHTQGVLLFTNDGETAKRLLDPKYKVRRTYLVKVSGVPDEKDLARLRKGVRLDYAPTAPIEASIVRVSGNNSFVNMRLVEGKNRHIKRVCEIIGHPVIKLTRTHFGLINANDVPLGEFRFLTPREIRSLKALVPDTV